MAGLRPIELDGRRGFEVLSPVDGHSLGSYAVTTAEEVAEALSRARKAQAEWGARPVKERVALMRKALQVILARQDEFIERLTAETGRPELDTLMIELFATCDAMNYYSKKAAGLLKDRKTGLHLLRMKSAKIVHRPLGVVAVISPWNGPLILSISPTLQALLAGNAVLLKPSEVTPDAGRIAGEIFEEAGFPPDLVQVLLGDGETGAALVEAGVDKVCFTGSVATGRKIGEACGRNLVPFTLELGGKDPMIVLEDAKVERAAGGAVFGGIMNTGQFCSGIERVYVVRAVADEFIQRVVERVESLEKGRDYGPFILDRQCDIVEQQVMKAIEAGARVLVGGVRDGNTFAPTVLVDVDHSMALMTEETFGPVIPIVVVEDEDEAISLANDCCYGLSASVWTKSKSRGEAVARRLQSGSVTINETSMIYGALELPFGGVKDSGFGQVNGLAGLHNYCHRMPILTDRFGAKEEAVWHPYTEDKTSKLRKALSAIWGSPLRHLL
jgi:succinate-semialdehyde dehydrogenase/glutarate-semialdehyde dehydrogenase